MGLPSSFLLGWLTIVVELVGGLMILVGALIPLATVPMMIVLFVAIITVHLPNGFSSIKLQSFDAAGAHFGQPGYARRSFCRYRHAQMVKRLCLISSAKLFAKRRTRMF